MPEKDFHTVSRKARIRRECKGCGRPGELSRISDTFSAPLGIEDKRETDIPVEFDGQAVQIRFLDAEDMWEGYDRLRVLNYSRAHVTLLCFNLNDRNSFLSIQEQWLPESIHHLSLAIGRDALPLILVGMQKDLLQDSQARTCNLRFISIFQGVCLIRLFQKEAKSAVLKSDLEAFLKKYQIEFHQVSCPFACPAPS